MCGGVGHMMVSKHKGVSKHKEGPTSPYHMQILPRTYRCTGEHWGHMGVFGYMGSVGRHLNVQGAHGCPPKCETCLPLRKSTENLFKAKLLYIKSWIIIREPPDQTGNEPPPDILIGGSGQDIKNKMANTSHL